MFGKVTRSSGDATTIKWESGAQSIHRIFPGGEIAIVAAGPRESVRHAAA
ncbi:MAG: hypothetical protein MZV49_12160 [Rhodopseudomonas palustris]|nr:hypothetical protein [Rhodopseudomonas palustris]